MNRRVFQSLFFLGIIGCCYLASNTLYELHNLKRSKVISRLIFLPEKVLKLVSLEYSGPLANYLMLQTLVFHGEHLMERQKPTPQQYQQTHLAIQQITNLDPKFWDPYVLAEMTLPWEAGMVKETNDLLLKAAKAREDDYRPYFFLWYNHYYFLKDPVTAAKYMKKSASIPGAPVYFPTLAARNLMDIGQTTNSIIFLKEILKDTKDQKRKEWISKRLHALQTIAFLEEYVKKYTVQYGSQPKSLNDLVTRDLLKQIPPDPYGGTFYLTSSGRVYTTSKLVPIKRKKYLIRYQYNTISQFHRYFCPALPLSSSCCLSTSSRFFSPGCFRWLFLSHFESIQQRPLVALAEFLLIPGC